MVMICFGVGKNVFYRPFAKFLIFHSISLTPARCALLQQIGSITCMGVSFVERKD
jgi:hypothetical protein